MTPRHNISMPLRRCPSDPSLLLRCLQVGWPGVGHVEGKIGETKDYSAVIQKALVSPVSV